MTTVIALRTDDAIYFGADRQTTNNYTAHTRATKKFFELLPGFVAGVSGSPAIAQAIRYGYDQHDRVRLESLLKNTTRPTESILWEIADLWRRILTALNALTVSDNKASMDAHILVAFRGELWHAEPNFQVTSLHQDFLCIGSGAELATGVLWATTDRPALWRVDKAMSTAGRFDPNTGSLFDTSKFAL